MKCEVDNKNEITTQDFLENNTSEIVDMCVVLRRNIYSLYSKSKKTKTNENTNYNAWVSALNKLNVKEYSISY